jgi:hypothetical protein
MVPLYDEFRAGTWMPAVPVIDDSIRTAPALVPVQMKPLLFFAFSAVSQPSHLNSGRWARSLLGIESGAEPETAENFLV